jgi:fumarate reductase subunit D
VKHLMLRLEPVIWVLFGAGMMVGGLLLPAYILVVGLAGPLGLVPHGALAYDRMYSLASNPIGRIVFAAAAALPLWGGAHHLRHVWIDFGGLRSDGLVGGLLYGIALVGSIFAVIAVVRL